MTQLRAIAAGFGCRAASPPAGARAVTFALAVAVAAAWTALIALDASMSHGSAAMSSMPGMPGMSPAGSAGRSMLASAGVAGGSGLWVLMVVAMMLPSTLPALRHVGANSLRWRRRRAMSLFVAVYVTTWSVVGIVFVLAVSAWPVLAAPVAGALALALAAAWQLTPHKRRALADCHRSAPLAPRGWQADWGVIRFAARNGLACLRSCWAMMLVMGLASSMVFWMVTLAGIVVLEKRWHRPRQAARAAAWLLAAGAFVAAVSALTPA